MVIRVTVEDTEAGTSEILVIALNDYFLCCTGTCYEDSVQAYPSSGTHVITLKGVHGILRQRRATV